MTVRRKDGLSSLVSCRFSRYVHPSVYTTPCIHPCGTLTPTIANRTAPHGIDEVHILAWSVHGKGLLDTPFSGGSSARTVNSDR